jgi:monooxygenase
MADTDFDVIVIGAGISGIGAACHLQRRLPGTRYAVLEARAELGGTWDLFKYPGVRSDSDLFTFGYDFKPWEHAEAIADGASIKAYIAETARENGVVPHIRFGHAVVDVDWSSAERRWILRVQVQGTGEPRTFKASWLFVASGYYRYDQGFTPAFDGMARFAGQVVHPQHWPADLDVRGRRVVVIGSGATAVTLVPALAAQDARVTLLQRTPSYILPVPTRDPVARLLRPLLGKRIAHAVTRRVNIAKQRWVYALFQRYPKRARGFIRSINARLLGEGYPVDVHFKPPYEPWDQRLCAVPGGDLFKALRSGKATMVTDRIATFTEGGLQLESGAHLEADIVVTATGLNLAPLGGLRLKLDGVPVHLADTIAFKGMMLSGVPNVAFAVGYTASSWTLKVGLLCEHFCRLLAYMGQRGFDVCTPVAPAGMSTRPLLDFGAGYVQRSIAELPRQGDAFPWITSWNYAQDVDIFRKGAVADKHLQFLARLDAPSTPAAQPGVRA